MRNMFILIAASAGAWFMGKWAMQVGTALVGGGSGNSPLGGLLLAPAVLIGALVGALLGGMVYPRAR